MDENDICPVSDHRATMVMLADRREYVCAVCRCFQASISVIAEMEQEAEAIKIARLCQARQKAKPDTVPYLQSDELSS